MYQNNINYQDMQINCIVIKPGNKTFVSDANKNNISRNIAKYEFQKHLTDVVSVNNRTSSRFNPQVSKIINSKSQVKENSSRRIKTKDCSTLDSSIFNEFPSQILNGKLKMFKNKKKFIKKICSKNGPRVRKHIEISD